MWEKMRFIIKVERKRYIPLLVLVTITGLIATFLLCSAQNSYYRWLAEKQLAAYQSMYCFFPEEEKLGELGEMQDTYTEVAEQFDNMKQHLEAMNGVQKVISGYRIIEYARVNQQEAIFLQAQEDNNQVINDQLQSGLGFSENPNEVIKVRGNYDVGDTIAGELGGTQVNLKVTGCVDLPLYLSTSMEKKDPVLMFTLTDLIAKGRDVFILNGNYQKYNYAGKLSTVKLNIMYPLYIEVEENDQKVIDYLQNYGQIESISDWDVGNSGCYKTIICGILGIMTLFAGNFGITIYVFYQYGNRFCWWTKNGASRIELFVITYSPMIIAGFCGSFIAYFLYTKVIPWNVYWTEPYDRWMLLGILIFSIAVYFIVQVIFSNRGGQKINIEACLKDHLSIKDNIIYILIGIQKMNFSKCNRIADDMMEELNMQKYWQEPWWQMRNIYGEEYLEKRNAFIQKVLDYRQYYLR